MLPVPRDSAEGQRTRRLLGVTGLVTTWLGPAALLSAAMDAAECWAGRCCEAFSGDVLTDLSGVGGPHVIR